MIAALNGTIVLIDIPHIIVDVNGVGYKVLVPHNFLSAVITGQKIQLFTHTHVREDLLELYGFLHSSDLKLFEKLISVSGIGPKTAIGVFSLGESKEITQAILKGDVDFFVGVPRLGKKNAQKLIIELKGKLGQDIEIDIVGSDGIKTSEIASALEQFGFSAKEAREAIKNVGDKGKTTEEKIKLALKYLGK